MSICKRTFLLGLATAAAMTLGAPAFAAGTTVEVSLWDKGPDSMAMAEGHKRMMGMSVADMPMAMMGVDATPGTAKAGEVTFQVVNASKDTIHEMVVAPVSDTMTPLPYNEAEDKVDEDAAGHLGEVAELDPGQSGALTLTLKPGTYILYCNIAGHYAAGMWTLFTVTP